MEKLSHSVNSFGSTLFSQLSSPQTRKGQAMFLSPWGIAHALAMVLQGAREGSESQRQLLATVYGSPAGAAAVRSAVQSLTASLTVGASAKDGAGLTVSDANSAWVKPDVALTDAYVAALASFFAAQAGPLASAAAVNAWVSEHTGGKITEIIDEGAARQAALILVNAIYFKGTWVSAFNERDTAPLAFTMLEGTSMDAAMMYLHVKKKGEGGVAGARFPAGGGDCVAVRMGYQGGAYHAVAAMPDGELAPAGNGPLKLADGRDYATALAACREALVGGAPLAWQTVGHPDVTAIKVYLPRFEVEFGATLSDGLKAMGLGALFVPGDFTEMTAEGDLAVSDVVHKTYVKVDEQGTEAAAATAVVMLRAAFRPEPELFVRFDRPFAFAVVHRDTGLALFVGEVYAPERWGAGR